MAAARKSGDAEAPPSLGRKRRQKRGRLLRCTRCSEAAGVARRSEHSSRIRDDKKVSYDTLPYPGGSLIERRVEHFRRASAAFRRDVKAMIGMADGQQRCP